MKTRLERAAEEFLAEKMTVISFTGSASPAVMKIYSDVCEHVKAAFVAGWKVRELIGDEEEQEK